MAGSSARCTAASWLLCLMEMSASDGDRMSWVDWVNQLFFLRQLRHMEPAMARHVSPQSGPCCSRGKEGGQQRRFLSWSISPVSVRTTYMETCYFMLLPFAYGIQVVDWGLRLLRLSLLLSLFGCFYNTCVFICSILLVRGSHDTLGEAESSTIERLARNASWHQRWLKVEWKVVLVKEFWERRASYRWNRYSKIWYLHCNRFGKISLPLISKVFVD